MVEPLRSSISIPGKIFILGEYAVLGGLPAIVACVPPRFSLEPASAPLQFHPKSPAGRLLAQVRDDGIGARFIDAQEGMGGFGGSTAEFALVAYALGIRDWHEVFQLYRETTAKDSRYPPSGADLVAQWLGGVRKVESTGNSVDVTDRISRFNWVVFSAAHLRKTPTHDHLDRLSNLEFGQLRLSLELGYGAIQKQDAAHLGAALSQYAEELRAMGLEHEGAHEDRAAFSELPGVYGAKGCGAMLSDSLLVLVDGPDSEAAAVELGEGRGLRLLARGLPAEGGIRASE